MFHAKLPQFLSRLYHCPVLPSLCSRSLATCSNELQIPLPHGTMAAKVWGSPDGIPVLGLHGWMDNAATFDGIAPLLTPSVRWIFISYLSYYNSIY